MFGLHNKKDSSAVGNLQKLSFPVIYSIGEYEFKSYEELKVFKKKIQLLIEKSKNEILKNNNYGLEIGLHAPDVHHPDLLKENMICANYVFSIIVDDKVPILQQVYSQQLMIYDHINNIVKPFTIKNGFSIVHSKITKKHIVYTHMIDYTIYISKSIE